MKNLKIGFVLDDSLDRPDGVQQYVRALGAWLAEHGHTVHYLVGESRPDGQTVHSLSRNVSIRFNKNRLTIPLPANRAAIKRLLARERYDVLHVQVPYSPMLAGRVIRSASPSTAVVGTFHILPFSRLHRVANKTLAVVQKASLARFDAICSVSAAAAAFTKSHWNLTTHVIPNMISLKDWRMPLVPHPARIVFLGRLVERKGCQQLLEAYALLPSELRRRTELLIAGDGPQRKDLESYTQKHHLGGVKFLGFIDEQDKPALLASAEIAVFPSLGGESFGIVLIEAMAASAGVVLGGNNPGYASVLADWPLTLLDPRDAAEFAKRLEHFLTDTKARKTIHELQQQAVRQYDVEVVGKQVLQMYKRALLHRTSEVR